LENPFNWKFRKACYISLSLYWQHTAMIPRVQKVRKNLVYSAAVIAVLVSGI
jgi:hypothetical protein